MYFAIKTSIFELRPLLRFLFLINSFYRRYVSSMYNRSNISIISDWPTIQPLSNHYPTTIQPLSNHYPPVSNHYPTTIQPLSTSIQPLSTIIQPLSNHYPTTIHHYPPLSNHYPPLSTTKQPLSNHYLRTNRTSRSHLTLAFGLQL